jgi:hypothetical protein
MTMNLTLSVERHGVAWTDTVTNLSDRPTSMQMLYHVNFGPPLLGAGAEVVAPVDEIVPRDAVAEADIAINKAIDRGQDAAALRAYRDELRNITGGLLLNACDSRCRQRSITGGLLLSARGPPTWLAPTTAAPEGWGARLR